VQALLDEVGPLLATGGSGSRFRRLDAFIAGTAKAFEEHQEMHHALFRAGGPSEAPLIAGFHALAALWHQFVLRDGLLSRMWPRT